MCHRLLLGEYSGVLWYLIFFLEQTTNVDVVVSFQTNKSELLNVTFL